MGSSKDYEELWLRYQKDGVPQKLSIVRFCEMNGIVYKHFETWYKSTHRKKIYPIEVLGVETNDREAGGSMFGLTDLMRFYFIPGVTDMRCGYTI